MRTYGKNGNTARYHGGSAHDNIVYYRKRYLEIKREALSRIRENDMTGALFTIEYCNKLLLYMNNAKRAAAAWDRTI